MIFTPISISDVLVSVTYMICKWIFLGLTFSFITKSRDCSESTLPSLLSFSVAIGMSIDTLLNCFLLIIGYFNTTTIMLLNVFFVFLLPIFILKFKSLKLKESNSNHIKYFFLISLIILVVRLLPFIGEYTYPGDDPKLYSFVSKRLIEEQSLANSWGPLIKDDWIIEKLHLYMIGFPSLVAEVSLATSIPIYKSVALVTQVSVWVTTLALYYYLQLTIKDKWISLIGMTIYGLFIFEPSLYWVSWGGNAELTGFSYMLLILASVHGQLVDRIDYRKMLVLMVATASLFLTHPFPIVYLMAGTLSFIVAYGVFERSFERIIKIIFFFAMSSLISIIMIFPVFTKMLIEELTAQRIYEPSVYGLWTPIFSPNQSFSEALKSLFERVYYVYGFGTVPFILSILLSLKHKSLIIKVRKKELLGFTLWWLTLFFLHENNPNGLWLVRFPFWYRIDPNRTFCATSFPFTIITSILLGELIKRYDEFSLGKLLSVKTVMSIILLSILLPVYYYLSLKSIIYSSVMFGHDDAVVFEKMLNFETEGGKIFVMPNDAGQWIPVLLGKPVVLPFGIATKHEILNTYYLRIYPEVSKDPCSPLVIRFFNENDIRYVYVGGKKAHLDLYPYILTESKAKNCGALTPILKSNEAVLYRFNSPNVFEIGSILIQPAIISDKNSFSVAIFDDIIHLSVNNSWVALIINLSVNLSHSGHMYILLRFWSEKGVHLLVEGVMKNGTLIRLTNPVSASHFFKWGNGTIGWVDDYYVRLPADAVRINLVFGGYGHAKLARSIKFVIVETREKS